jgi:hypothetical protein
MNLWYKTLEEQMDHLARAVARAEKRRSDQARVGALAGAVERLAITAAREPGRVGLRLG